MRICIANLSYNLNSEHDSPAVFLEGKPFLRHVPESLAGAGHEVHVVQLFPTPASFRSGRVMYHFVAPVRAVKGLVQMLGRLTGQSWNSHVPATNSVRQVLRLEPEVVHFMGLWQNASLFLMRLLGGDDGPAIVCQDDGRQAGSGWLETQMSKRSLARVQRAIFTGSELVGPYLKAGMLAEPQLAWLPSQTTTFSMGSRPMARREHRVSGSPVFLWLADLVAERDPMTAVQGFERILKTWPKAQLYMYYGRETLLTQLRAYVLARRELAGQVYFRGRVAPEAREGVLNSADFLLQTDQVANGGQTIVEAMACGVIPVVSDNPEFRLLVDNGRCGFIFPTGEPQALAEAVLAFSPARIAGRAAVVHDWFESAYSYDAQAGLLLDIYHEATAERQLVSGRAGMPLTESGS